MVNFKRMLFSIKHESNRLLWSCVLMTTGAGLFLGAHSLLNYILQLSLTIRENSALFHLWKENPMPLYFRLYAYNWTNPEDVHKPHVKPKFHQIGPFVFREIKEKRNVTFNANDTVSFRQYHTFFFERDLSVADLSTKISTINPVITSAAYIAETKNWGYLRRKMLQGTISQFNENLPIVKTIGASLFEGYDDIFVTLGNNIPFLKFPPIDKFGWFYMRNGSTWEGDFNMGSSYHNFGVLQSWNYANHTQSYEGPCGNLTGISAGELYQPNRTKDRIAFLMPDLCRPVPLDFDEEVVVQGIRGYKYSVGTSFLDNGVPGTVIPENKCFCHAGCLPSGVVNIASCQWDAPGFISLPNFYGADECYTQAIEGVYPQKEKHEFFITLEPITGIPLQVVARLQLNILLQPIRHINTFEQVPHVVFPVMWVEEVVTIPTYLGNLLKLFLSLPTGLQVAGALLMAIGLCLVIQSVYRRIRECSPRSNTLDIDVKELQVLYP